MKTLYAQEVQERLSYLGVDIFQGLRSENVLLKDPPRILERRSDSALNLKAKIAPREMERSMVETQVYGDAEV